MKAKSVENTEQQNKEFNYDIKTKPLKIKI